MPKKKLFCEMNPFFYQISVKKEIFKKHIKNLLNRERYAKTFSNEKLPHVIYSHSSNMIKRAPGVDLTHQLNKAVNIEIASSHISGIVIHPGECFSFWKNVGKITKRKGYKVGRIIKKNKLVADVGGGLCNLGHTLNLLILHSPLKITEIHFHSDALAPDEGERKPFNAGTSVFYNYGDYRFKNTLDQDVQIIVWCDGEDLKAELRSEKPISTEYQLVEEDHHFKEKNGKFYRNSKIYINITDKDTGETVDKKLVRDNHSEVMFEYSLIPQELIRQ